MSERKVIVGPRFEHPFGLAGDWWYVAEDTNTKRLEDTLWLRFWAKTVLLRKDRFNPYDN